MFDHGLTDESGFRMIFNDIWSRLLMVNHGLMMVHDGLVIVICAVLMFNEGWLVNDGLQQQTNSVCSSWEEARMIGNAWACSMLRLGVVKSNYRKIWQWLDRSVGGLSWLNQPMLGISTKQNFGHLPEFDSLNDVYGQNLYGQYTKTLWIMAISAHHPWENLGKQPRPRKVLKPYPGHLLMMFF